MPIYIYIFFFFNFLCILIMPQYEDGLVTCCLHYASRCFIIIAYSYKDCRFPPQGNLNLRSVNEQGSLLQKRITKLLQLVSVQFRAYVGMYVCLCVFSHTGGVALGMALLVCW